MTSVEQIEAAARARFVSWDVELWREAIDGPAQQLAGALAQSSDRDQDAAKLVTSYLSLAAEAIGLGYLFPARAVGRENFVTLAWLKLIPERLGDVPAAMRASVLAQLWNLGENLERSPVWVRRVFQRLLRDVPTLVDLEQRVAAASECIANPPSRPLEQRWRAEWLWLGDADARFLPGPMHFVAPTVLCVHDRHRGAFAGRQAATLGIWLDETPLVIGAMGCAEQPVVERSTALPIAALQSRDARVTEVFASTRNDWRGAIALETSQALVAVLPA